MNPLLLSLGSKLIDRFVPGEEEKAKAKVELIEAEQKGELTHLEHQVNIILTEAKSKDSFTSRARPSFMYVFYAILLVNCMIAPLLGVWWPDQMAQYYANLGKGLNAIPTELWVLFGTAFTGYTMSRSYDKKQVIHGKEKLKEMMFNRFAS